MNLLIAQVLESVDRSTRLLAQATPASDAPPAPGSLPAAAPAPSAAPAGEATPDEVDEAAASTETPWYKDMLSSGAMGYMIEGGLFMWPLLLLGVVAAGVIIERFRSLKMLGADNDALRGEVIQLLHEDRPEDALALCDRQQGPVPAILSAGLRKYVVLRRLNYDSARIEQGVVKTMDDYGVHIVAALERHLPILATVASAAPMLGFLGTVQGMVLAFDDIVIKMGEVNIVEAAAAGIKVALLTTVLGLIVGLPAFIAYNYFTSVINRFVLDVEKSSTDLIEAVTLQMALAGDVAETPPAPESVVSVPKPTAV